MQGEHSGDSKGQLPAVLICHKPHLVAITTSRRADAAKIPSRQRSCSFNACSAHTLMVTNDA